MKLRAEVEEALSEAAHILQDDLCTNVHCLSCRTPLLALVELGVRLALAKAAETARAAYVPIVDYFGDDGAEGLRNAAADILALAPADILQAQPGAEGVTTSEGHVCGFNGFDGRKDRCARCEELWEPTR